MNVGDKYTGTYEVAIGENIYLEEANNLQTQGAHCTKNPGHVGFTAVKDFQLSHLPPQYQDEDVLNHFQNLADITVLVRNTYVSPSRPEGFPGSQYRGTWAMQTGTGYCWGVDRHVKRSDFHNDSKPGKDGYIDDDDDDDEKEEEDEDKTVKTDCFCECQICQQSGQPKSCWWEVHVQTASHVVCDELEAANTNVVFFYDDTESQKITIPGSRVEYTNVDTDHCTLVCVIHDGEMDEFINKLKGLIQDVRRVDGELKKKYSEIRKELCVIVSHPHGSTKQISVGERLEIGRDSEGRPIWYYNTPTCPGSSGAVVGWNTWRFGLYFPPHCKGEKDGLGTSGRLRLKCF